MNPNPLINEIDSLLRYLEDDNWLIQTLDSIIYTDENLDKQHLELESFVKKVLGSDSTFFSKNIKLKEVSNEVYKSLATVRSKLKTISAKKLFLKLSRLEIFLTAIVEHADDEAEAIRDVLAELNRFSLNYETYLENQTDVSTIRVFSVAVDLETNIKFLKNILGLIRHSLKAEQAKHYPNPLLTLPVSKKIQYEQLVEKITAIQSIYRTLCQLLNISLKDDPIHVVNDIQFGELALQIVGNIKVLSLMDSLMKSMDTLPKTLAIINENASSKEIETLVEFFHLSEQLEKNGLEVGDKKKLIQQVAVKMVKQLLLLKDDTKDEKVNNQVRFTTVDTTKELSLR
jgi:hypothetical protein